LWWDQTTTMQTKYNLNETVYFLHGQKIMSGRITALYIKSVLKAGNEGVKTTEEYTVEFDIENRATFDQARDISVVLLHPSREALIESL